MIVECVKVVYLIYQLTTNTNTMKTNYTTLHIANDDLKLILQSLHAERMSRINRGYLKFEDIDRLEHILGVTLNSETLTNADSSAMNS